LNIPTSTKPRHSLLDHALEQRKIEDLVKNCVFQKKYEHIFWLPFEITTELMQINSFITSANSIKTDLCNYSVLLFITNL